MASMIHNRYASTTFDWIIKDFSKVNSEGLYSDVFSVGGFEWQLQIYLKPKGYTEVHEYLSVYLIPVDSTRFPFVDFSVSLLNLFNHNESARQGFKHKFNKDSSYGWGLPLMPVPELHEPNKGYIMHDTCVLRVEVSCRTVDDDAREDMNESNPEKVMQLGEYSGAGQAGQAFGEGQNNSKIGFGEDKQEFEDIGGFHILKTQAPLYRRIWLNYGHIPSTRVMPISSYPILVMMVKDLMSSITDMYQCHYVDLSSEMIQSWEDMINKGEKFEFNIGWLRKRFEHVKKRMGGMHGIQNVKNELQEHGQRLRATKSKMRVVRDVMTNVELEMIAEKDDLREKISGLLSESEMETYLEIGEDLLLDGLLDGVYG